MALTANPDGRLFSATWTRRRYYVADGFIRPIPEAPREEYDPFEAYEQGRIDPSVQALHIALADLDLDDTRAIEAFVSQWGLLGMFQHDLIQAQCLMNSHGDLLPKSAWWLDGIESPALQFPIWPAHRTLVEATLLILDDWLKRGWAVRGASGEPELTPQGPWGCFPPDIADPHVWIGIASEVLGRQDCEGSGTVIVMDGETSVPLPLEVYYSTYFPSLCEVREDYPVPVLRSDVAAFPSLRSPRFWDLLCEPLAEFREQAAEFADHARRAAQRDRMFTLNRRISQHLTRVHPAPVIQASLAGYRPSDDPLSTLRWRLGWSFPSLLSAAYMMLALDMSHENRLKVCGNENCGRLFTAGRPDQLFCSAACLAAQKAREYRRRQKQRKEQAP